MKLGVLLIIIACLPLVWCSDTAIGEIRVSIQNRAPVITSVSLAPEEADDTRLCCLAAYNDELPEKVKLYYAWYVNGERTQDAGISMTGYSPGDNVKCEVHAEDELGAESQVETASITVQSRQPSLTQITGAVTGGGTASPAIALVALTGLSLLGIRVRRAR